MESTHLLNAAVSLILGLCAGWVMHRSGFCLAGAFRDIFLFRTADMFRALVLLVAATAALFEAARLAGLLPLYPFPSLGAPTPANVIGGFLFGVGMVLAGGCVVGTLYRMGAGSTASAVAFAGLVAGSAAYAEFHPAWAAFIRRTTPLPGQITLPQIAGVGPTLPILLVAAAGGMLAWRWHRQGKLRRPSHAAGYLQPWHAALLLSLVSLASYLAVGMPLGVTTSYAKLGAYLEMLVAPGHVRSLAFFQAVPLRYVHPLTGIEIAGGAGPVFDAISSIQFPLVAGIVLGSALSAARLGEWRLRRGVPARQMAWAFAGGVVMGLASRMAPACNVWHLMGGLPILGASSLLFLAGLFPGAWAGGRILTTLVIPNAAPPRQH